MPRRSFSSELEESPVPMAATRRPAAMSAKLPSEARTTSSGSRPMRATRVPMWTRLVEATRAPSIGYTESAGRAGLPIGQRWSKTKTPWTPASSAARAAAMTPAASGLNVGRVTPICIA
jgi:hypothetical protein